MAILSLGPFAGSKYRDGNQFQMDRSSLNLVHNKIGSNSREYQCAVSNADGNQRSTVTLLFGCSRADCGTHEDVGSLVRHRRKRS